MSTAPSTTAEISSPCRPPRAPRLRAYRAVSALETGADQTHARHSLRHCRESGIPTLRHRHWPNRWSGGPRDEPYCPVRFNDSAARVCLLAMNGSGLSCPPDAGCRHGDGGGADASRGWVLRAGEASRSKPLAWSTGREPRAPTTWGLAARSPAAGTPNVVAGAAGASSGGASINGASINGASIAGPSSGGASSGVSHDGSGRQARGAKCGRVSPRFVRGELRDREHAHACGEGCVVPAMKMGRTRRVRALSKMANLSAARRHARTTSRGCGAG